MALTTCGLFSSGGQHVCIGAIANQLASFPELPRLNWAVVVPAVADKLPPGSETRGHLVRIALAQSQHVGVSDDQSIARYLKSSVWQCLHQSRQSIFRYLEYVVGR
jgi:hypothetical protein